ncbi:MAG: lipopolysaccharide heptosyltransferase II [Candidatus Eisenbacteria bacterium]|nr:lipopolysaccharide heptosyltransferase II [Candidatus Latescibacterota bacterium]MBD3301823.1 lipopolysaccharide heptosyltransferase II [Candidatus Eisenbacteria bacterium]
MYGRWPDVALLTVPPRSRAGERRLWRQLRGVPIDAAVVFAPSLRTALVPWLLRIPRRIGFRTDRRGPLLTDAVPSGSRERHLARQFLDLAVRLGADAAAPLDPRLPVGEDEREAAGDRLREIGFAGEETVALCPGATYGETKRWPLASWLALSSALIAGGRTIVVLGGGEEVAAGEAIARNGGAAAQSLAGRLSLRESLAMLGRLAGCVSNDSGAMHLAAAAGCPVVGVFGSTNPSWTGPLGARARVVTLGLACSPCYSSRCPTSIECLRDLDPDRVRAALLGLLEQAPPEGAG